MTRDAASVDRDLIAAVLDRLIPPEAGFPGGGAVACDHVAAAVVSDPRGSTLLQAIEQRSRSLVGRNFVALTEDEKLGVLHALEADQGAAFNAFLVHAYGGYYSSPVVVKALGLPAGPPSRRPHHLEPLQPSRLDDVARRGPIYKPV